MKKSIKLVLIFIIVLAIFSVVLTSCSAQTYKHRLENKGYVVYYYDKYADGVTLIWSTMIAAGLEKEDADWTMFAYDKAKGETVVLIVRFKKKKNAQKYYDYLSSHKADSDNVEIVEMKNKDVIFGSEKGVQDAKG
ncbi:MAG: hypothetical protein J5656_00190 [Clostridia bacterium]|nr:hypothetical protein [Clostridia bacterium]